MSLRPAKRGLAIGLHRKLQIAGRKHTKESVAEDGIHLHGIKLTLNQALLLQILIIIKLSLESLPTRRLQVLKILRCLILYITLILLIIPSLSLEVPIIPSIRIISSSVIRSSPERILSYLVAVLDGDGESVEEADDALEEAVPAGLDCWGNLVGTEAEEGDDGDDGELLVVHALEVLNVGKPEGEELVGPVVVLEDLECDGGVVVDAVDDHLHEVKAIRLHAYFGGGGEEGHGGLDEAGEVLVGVATKGEEDGLRQLAAADAVYGAKAVMRKDGVDDGDNSLEVSSVLLEHLGAVGDIVVEGREHVLDVDLGTVVEGLVHEFKHHPHSR